MGISFKQTWIGKQLLFEKGAFEILFTGFTSLTIEHILFTSKIQTITRIISIININQIGARNIKSFQGDCSQFELDHRKHV